MHPAEMNIDLQEVSTDNAISGALIGSLLTAPETLPEVMLRLKPEDLINDGHRELLQLLYQRKLDNKPIDVMSIAGACGSFELVNSCIESPHKSDPSALADMILERAKLRRLKDKAASVMFSGSVEAAEAKIAELIAETSNKRELQISSSCDAAQEFMDAMNRPAPDYLRFGIRELDKYLRVEPGDFIAVGGYPSSGKTTLSLQFAAELARENRCGYFSLETSRGKLMDRIMSQMSGIELRKIKDRDLSDSDWVGLTDAAEKFSRRKLDLIDAAGMTAHDIEAVTISRGYKIIFVDYLQLIQGGGGSRYETVTQISIDLHTLAQKHKVCVIALAQLHRPDTPAKNQKPKPPTMSDFRESGQIEQDVDTAMILYPEDMENNRSARVLKIAKNKDGERGRAILDFDGARQIFTAQEQKREFDREMRQLAELKRTAKENRARQNAEYYEQEKIPF